MIMVSPTAGGMLSGVLMTAAHIEHEEARPLVEDGKATALPP